MLRPLTAWLVVALAAAVPAQVAAQTTATAVAAAGPTWADLTLAQQAALTPLKAHWSQIDANGKAKWMAVAQRFPSMPAEERQRVQARMAEWTAMTPAERGRARQNFQELRNLPGEDRQALWEAYRALPPEQRQELAQRARPAPAATRPATDPTPPTARRLVPVNPPPPTVKPVTPTVVQVKPGATTTLVSKPASPPLHNQPGLPKIAATPGFVHPQTLLPRRGPQGAATVKVPAGPAAAPAAAAEAATAASAATSAAAASAAPAVSAAPSPASAASSGP